MIVFLRLVFLHQRNGSDIRKRDRFMPYSHLSMLPDAVVRATTIPFADCSTKLPAIMSEFGFCVVDDVLPPDDVIRGRGLFGQDLRTIIALDDEKFAATPLAKVMAKEGKDIVECWQHPTYQTGRLNPSFASDFGLPQGKAAWFCRQHPNVQAVFGTLFPNEVLCCGTDVVFFNNVPPSEDPDDQDDAKREDSLWPHADQSIYVPDSGKWNCFQSIVYLSDATTETSSTVMWPGSHKGPFDEMMEKKAPGNHYSSLPISMYEDFKTQCGRVPLKKGSMIVWNSKTIHQGWNIGPRLAFPICFEPKARRSPEALETKRMCVVRGYPTTHWASLGLPHGVASIAPGGSKAFPLRTRANQWAVVPPHKKSEGGIADEDDEGTVIPEIDDML